MTVTGEQGSTVPRRRLGRELRRLREGAQLTIEAAIKELQWSRQKIWRIERGESAMRVLDVAAMCRVYGASDELTEALMAVAKETKARGWYHAHGDAIPKWMEMYVDLEKTATRISEYRAEIVPGLLQTRAYAEAVFKTSVTLAASEIDRQIEIRMTRQSLLAKEGLKIDWLFNESVIRRVVDCPTVMAEQLKHVASFAQHPTVTVRIVPYAAGAHTSMLGSYNIYDFPKETEPTIAQLECLTGDLFLEKEREVDAYRKMFRNTSDIALNETESRELLLSAANEFATAAD